jgi:hypothetical protein
VACPSCPLLLHDEAATGRTVTDGDSDANTDGSESL